jgi:hypothetical protein
MQSYYGTSPAAKGFEVAQCESELKLPEGIAGTRNGKIPAGGGRQKQEESSMEGCPDRPPDSLNILAVDY